MHFEDLQRICICFTLWDNYATTMNDYIQSTKDRPLIVLLQLCRSNKFKEVGVSNSLYNITRMFVNSSIPEIDQFRDSLPRDENMSSSQVSQVSVFSSQTILEEVDNKVHEVVTLDAIPAINQDVFVFIVAMVSGFNKDMGWYFQICKNCRQRANRNIKHFSCDSCGQTERGTRYKLIATVCDGTNNLSLLFWDDQCKELFNKTTLDILSSLQVDTDAKNTDPFSKGKGVYKFPFRSDFNDLIGQEFLFKVHVQERNFDEGDPNYVVRQLSGDPILITKCKRIDQAIELEDDDDELVNSKASHDHDSVSDNEVMSPIKTPLKRHTGGHIEDGTGSVNQPTAKLCKVIKMEDK